MSTHDHGMRPVTNITTSVNDTDAARRVSTSPPTPASTLFSHHDSLPTTTPPNLPSTAITSAQSINPDKPGHPNNHGQVNKTSSTISSSTPTPTTLLTPRSADHALRGGEGESALPEDKWEEALERLDEDWQHDSDNPRNWSFWTKWRMAAIVSLYTFVSPVSSSMMAPALPNIGVHFHISSTAVLDMTLSIFLLAYAVGPLILGPLSEVYGRKWVLHISNIFFLIFNLACAFAPNTTVLIVFRFIAGLGGSAPVSIGGGVIGDLFSERDRATAMAIFTLGPLLGPSVGPVAGGFIAGSSIGFKWIFIVIALSAAVAAVLGIPFLKETYAPIIRLRRAKKRLNASTSREVSLTKVEMGEEQGDVNEKVERDGEKRLGPRDHLDVNSTSRPEPVKGVELLSADSKDFKDSGSGPDLDDTNHHHDSSTHDDAAKDEKSQHPHHSHLPHLPHLHHTHTHQSHIPIRFKISTRAEHELLLSRRGPAKVVLWLSLTRPFALLFKSFICFILSFYMGLSYGYYYLMFATFPDVFTNIYGFSPGLSGLAYLGPGIGFALSTVYGAYVADAIYHHLSAKNGGKGKPEFRIPALIFASCFLPVGLFWYGWSVQARAHWIVPIIGAGVFAFGMMNTFLPIQLYLVDSFRYAASAIAAATVLRSLLGFIFPLFGEQMFRALGNGPGYSLLAGVSIIFGIPFPIWIYYRGEEIRKKSNLNR